jgi:methylated-DNA-[protein]-cysteine S-methyltransferase
VTLSYQDAERVLDTLAARASPRVLARRTRLDPVRRQLDDYFAGRRQAFDVQLDWQ